jgi:hypothetical protein
MSEGGIADDTPDATVVVTYQHQLGSLFYAVAAATKVQLQVGSQTDGKGTVAALLETPELVAIVCLGLELLD